MSRYVENDDCDYNNGGDLWSHNVQQALRGKRGKKALAEFREALMALPEKRLVADAACTVNLTVPEPVLGPPAPPGTWDAAYWRRRESERAKELLEAQGRGVCAVAAFAWHQKVKAGMAPEAAFAAIPELDSQDSDMYETTILGKQAGLAGVLAWELAYVNDEEMGHLDPEQRYVAFMEWIDRQLALPPLQRAKARRGRLDLRAPARVG